MRTHKGLDVLKNSIELVKIAYNVTSSFPKDELYGFTNQIRRTAISIPSNIAEGAGRNHNKEFIQFLDMDQGSLSELETQFKKAKELDFIKEDIYDLLLQQINQIRAQFVGLIKHLQNK